MKTHFYRVRAITNLHPGSGDADYGVVDKLVQRDPVTGFPTIYMSAVKGAMREYFERHSASSSATEEQKAVTNLSKGTILEIFGSDPKAQSQEVKQGKLRFVSADLLAIPRMSEDSSSNHAYQLCYVNSLLEDWKAKAALFGIAMGDVAAVLTANAQKRNEVSMSVFKELCENLPVVARNYLDNGESKNLWYEEFVPRETVFGLLVQGPEALMSVFSGQIDGKVIQLGGNATVGYGYCLFSKMAEA